MALGLFKLVQVPTASQVADGMTKAVPADKLEVMCKEIGLVDMMTPSQTDSS